MEKYRRDTRAVRVFIGKTAIRSIVVMGQYLTKELLQKMFYDTWDGKLPSVYGADGTLLEIVPK